MCVRVCARVIQHMEGCVKCFLDGYTACLLKQWFLVSLYF